MINELAEAIKAWRESKGFVTPSSIEGDHGKQMLGKLMLVVTEVSEAAEAVRHEDLDNFEEEIADVFIRLLDICATMGIDIDAAIDNKMIVNMGRPRLHGKKSEL